MLIEIEEFLRKTQRYMKLTEKLDLYVGDQSRVAYPLPERLLVEPSGGWCGRIAGG